MHWLLLWAAWVSINLAATISPGPAFAMTVRTAIAHNRRAGIIQSLGLGLGVGFHVLLVIFGLAAIMATSATAFEIFKLAGAAYLIYLGSKAIRAKKKQPENLAIEPETPLTNMSDTKSFRTGFLTNMLNPKSLIFYSAVLPQFISGDVPWQMIMLFGLTAVATECLWFSFVTCILTAPRVKNKFLSVSHWIERICGGLMIALGLRLAFEKGLRHA